MQQFYTIINVSEIERWNKALENVPHSFAHTAEHCKAVHIDTGHRTFLYLFEKDDVKICCPLIERDFNGSKDIAKPFGISGFTGNGFHNDFYESWMKFVQTNSYISGYLGLHPLFGNRSFFPDKSLYHHNIIQVLNIQPDLGEIVLNMSRNRRRQISSWDEIQNNLTADPDSIKHFFLDHYYNFLDRKKADSYYYFSDKAMESFFNTEKCIIVGAKEDNRVVSATYFGYSNYLADSLFHFSLPGKSHYSAALIWYAVIELKKRGVPLLNMGGGGGGIAKFKRRFGTVDYPLLSVKQIYNRSEYSRLTGIPIESVEMTDHSGFFPKYRKV